MRVNLTGVFSAIAVFSLSSTLSAAVVPGTSPGSFTVGASGTAQYSFPIALPPGIRDVSPQLSFQYSSQVDNGLLGVGWSIGGLPSITRCPQTLPQDGVRVSVTLTAADRFCLNGQRLILVSGTYGAQGAEYRTELDTFSRVISYTTFTERGPDSFKVWTKEGQVIEFGGTADSRLVANQSSVSGSSSTTDFGLINNVALRQFESVLQWNANKVSDRNSNYYTINYAKNDLLGQINPVSINYTGNDAVGQVPVLPSNSIVFSVEVPSDYFKHKLQYVAGSRISSAKVLRRVDIFTDGVLTRKYKLAYKSDSPAWVAARLRLDNVTECAVGISGVETCFEPTRFDMSNFSGCMYESHKSTLALPAVVGAGVYIPLPQDFDGDGRTDLVSAKIDGGGFRVLSAKSSNAVPSEGEFSNGATCATAIKPGQAFDAAVSSAVTTINHGISANWVMTAGDVNDDGLPEIVAIPLTGALNPIVAVRQASGIFTRATNSISDTSNYSGTTHNAYGGERAWLTDIDGDGKKDIVAIKFTGVTTNNTNVAVFFRKGFGDALFAQTIRQDLQIGRNDSPLGFNTSIGDVNGDGRSDIVFTALRGAIITADVLLGSGSGNTIFNNSATSSELMFHSRFDNALGSGAHTRISLLDVNRDGLADLVFFKVLKGAGSADSIFNQADIAVALSGGEGRFLIPSRSRQSLPQALSTAQINTLSDLTTIPWKTTFADINGDGRPDLVVSHVMADTGVSPSKRRLLTFTYINRGDGFFVLKGASWATNTTEPSLAEEGSWVRVSGDFDGDGLGELASVQVNNSAGYQIFPVFSRSPFPDLLKKITDGNGSVTTVAHAPLTRDEVYTKGTSSFPRIAIRAPIYVVSTVKRDSGNSLAPASWSYAYTGAAMDAGGRGFLGFASQAVTDPLGITTTTTFSQAFPYSGMVTNLVSVKGSTTLSSVVHTPGQKVISHASGKASYFPFVASSLAKQYEYSSATQTSQTHTVNDFDSWGRLLSSVAITTGNGSYSQTTTNSYFPNIITPTAWRVGEISQRLDQRTAPLPAGVTSDLTRTMAWTYDAAGLVHTVEVEPANAQLKTTTAVARDRFGNVKTSSVTGLDILTRGESINYDVSGRFVISKSNEEGHVTGPIVMDKRFGLPQSVTDPNGTFGVRQYDGFGRLTREEMNESGSVGVGPDSPYADIVYLSCDASCDLLQGETYIVGMTRKGMAPVFAYYDRNGRERRKVTKAMDGRDTVTATEYDALGRVVRTSKPYFADATGIQWVNRSYDAIGRISSESLPGGRTTTYTYSGRVASTTNPRAQVTKKTFDALGRLVATTDAAGKVQSFAYDAFGNVIRSNDSKGNLIINQYDLLGRKTEQQDPDLGTWTYQYNVLGQLVQQQDAKSQITNFTYDKLGRLLTRTEPGLNSVWTWDTASNGIGKLAKLTGANGFERTYSYDGFGRSVLASTKKTIDPNAQAADPDFFHIATFDSAGRPASITYPTGFGYENVYDDYGYLSEVRHKDSKTLYWRALERDAEGRVTREMLGNNLVTDRAYKVDTGHIETILTGELSSGVLTATVQNNTFAFDQVGNLTSRSKLHNPAQLEMMSYDNLNRLQSVAYTDPRLEASTASFDEIGNITNRSDVGAYTYAGCGGAHRVCGMTGYVNSAFTYDANGNMTSGNGRTVTWTSYNYPLKITQGTTTESFLYTPERERVRRTSVVGGQTTTTLYLSPRIDLGGTFEKTYKPGSVVEYTHHVYAGSQVIGAVVTSTPISSVSLWGTDLATAPTSMQPNATGVTMPAVDPDSLVSWSNTPSPDEAVGGRLLFATKPTAQISQPQLVGQRSYLNDNVIFRAELTTTVNSGTNGRYILIGLQNNGTVSAASKTQRQHQLLLRGSSAYVTLMDGTATGTGGSLIPVQVNLNYAIADNTTYVVEVESTPTTSVLYLYKKGENRAKGVRHAKSLVWRGATNTLVRRLVASAYGDSTEDLNETYVDNFSESTFAVRQEHYFHTDHLGSLVEVSDFAGVSKELLNYDAWGKRLFPSGEYDDDPYNFSWFSHLSASPTTSNPNPTGLTMPNPSHGLISWTASPGGRLVFTTLPLTAPAIRSVVRQKTYLDGNVTYRADVITTSNTGASGRYFQMDVKNNGFSTAATKTRREVGLLLRGSKAYAVVMDGSVTDGGGNLASSQIDLNFTVANNAQYTVEIETTPTLGAVYIYALGQSRAQGARRVVALDWKGASGTLVRQMSMSTYGAPTETSNITYVDDIYEWSTTRAGSLKGLNSRHGFTLHEHLDNVGLVHMNGRVYDPLMGRFLSPDPHVFYPHNMQDFNRYSYVHNNPLRLPPSTPES